MGEGGRFDGWNSEWADWLPRFLRPGEARGTHKARSVAGAPQKARWKRPATPVGMTVVELRVGRRSKAGLQGWRLAGEFVACF